MSRAGPDQPDIEPRKRALGVDVIIAEVFGRTLDEVRELFDPVLRRWIEYYRAKKDQGGTSDQ